MKLFVPKHVYYEQDAVNYPSGRFLLEKYKNQNIPCNMIESHNNIPEMRNKPDEEFPKMKDYLIIGIRKSLRYTPNCKTSDFLVPYTSSGCSAMCLYCYLVCTFFKCSYLRIFVNREQMMNKLIKTAQNSDKELTLEIGSNSDLVLENTVTGNLEWTIKEFSNVKKGFLTLPTKFHMIEPLLNINHNGRTIIRMSVNPQEIIQKAEFGTSRLDDRINAVNKLYQAGYKTGILIAPIILVDNWLKLYTDLIYTLKNKLNPGLQKSVFFELIFMTYGYAHKTINNKAFPNAIDLYDKTKMSPRGRGKYAYKKELKENAGNLMLDLVSTNFPAAKIEYIV